MAEVGKPSPTLPIYRASRSLVLEPGKSRPGRQPATPRLQPVKGAYRMARAAKPVSARRSSAAEGEAASSSGSPQASTIQASMVISHCHRARTPRPAAAATCCVSQSASRAVRPSGTASRYAASTWLATIAAGSSRTMGARSVASEAPPTDGLRVQPGAQPSVRTFQAWIHNPSHLRNDPRRRCQQRRGLQRPAGRALPQPHAPNGSFQKYLQSRRASTLSSPDCTGPRQVSPCPQRLRRVNLHLFSRAGNQ